MGVAVVVPWRAGCPHREAAWAWVQARYAEAHPTWEVVEGPAPEGPWCKAAAVQAGIDRTDADVLVVADADVWCEGLDQAVAALSCASWAIPHSHVHRLDLEATRIVLAGMPLMGALDLDRKPYRGHLGGGIVVLPRAGWELAPLDRRFTGWGQEDDSWGLALTRMLGQPWRGRQRLWHLWHPPAPRLSQIIGSKEGRELFERYRRARSQVAMAALIEEGR